MTDETKLSKRPKRWLAFLLNLLIFPAGYVYAGAAKWAVGLAVILTIAMASMVAWTLLCPPGLYGISLLRGDEDRPAVALLKLGLGCLFAIHAALIARPRTVRGVKAWALAIGLYAGIMGLALGWRFLGPYPTYDIPSGSMTPTVQVGDVILARGARGPCNTPDLKAGQVILSRENGVTFIRRAVAGPGQTVQMSDGRLWIDGTPVKAEPMGPGAGGQLVRETLPGGKPYLTLDLGQNSPLDDVPAARIPPGHWYLLGDNRDNAMDSRVDGPVPADMICAQAIKILYSDDKAAIGRRLD